MYTYVSDTRGTGNQVRRNEKKYDELVRQRDEFKRELRHAVERRSRNLINSESSYSPDPHPDTDHQSQQHLARHDFESSTAVFRRSTHVEILPSAQVRHFIDSTQRSCSSLHGRGSAIV